MAEQASEWPSLASDFWWLVHSEQSGALHVDAVVAGFGLAGALLCELVTMALVVVDDDGRLHVDPIAVPMLLGNHEGLYGAPVRQQPATGELPGWVSDLLRLMLVEPQPLPVVDWLAYLARDACQTVADRMLSEGLVRAERAHRWSRRKAYLPTSVNQSGWVAARLRLQLERGGVFSLDDRVLIGLCLATAITRRVFDGIRPELVTTLGGVPDDLPQPLPQVLRRLEVAVASAVMHRP